MAAIMTNTRFDFKKATGGDAEKVIDPALMLNTRADIDYLTRYPDVAESINNGNPYGLKSGYHHYQIAGKSEGRTYNLSLNDAPVTKTIMKSNTAKYLLIGVIFVGAVAVIWKFRGKFIKK